MHRILVVDDDPQIRFFLDQALKDEAMDLTIATDAESALALLEKQAFDLVLMDVRLPKTNGLDALRQIKRCHPQALVIVMTAYSSKDTAMEALRRGAHDYFNKPFKVDELRTVIRRALEKSRLLAEASRASRPELCDRAAFPGLIGQSESFLNMLRRIERVARVDSTVLIAGESGTGKELVAQAIHDHSPRKDKPIVKINCAAIPETLLESELFGYKMGAFTNADRDKEGKFQAAHQGTLVLDEIGDMNLDLQAKILRALEQQEVQRVGSTKTEKVDVRAIASTNRSLDQMIGEGKFREDLYYRLAVFQIEVPPLRSRFGDIPLLAQHFVKSYGEWFGRPLAGMTERALAVFNSYPWPGNIRELRNCIEVAAVMAEGDLIDVDDLPPYLIGRGPVAQIPGVGHPASLDETLVRIEKHILMDTLRKTGGVQAKAAAMLGITERSMWHRVKKYEIPVESVKNER